MNNTVEVVFVLDRSGSMSGKASDITAASIPWSENRETRTKDCRHHLLW